MYINIVGCDCTYLSYYCCIAIQNFPPRRLVWVATFLRAFLGMEAFCGLVCIQPACFLGNLLIGSGGYHFIVGNAQSIFMSGVIGRFFLGMSQLFLNGDLVPEVLGGLTP